jgi:hypothetical protein
MPLEVRQIGIRVNVGDSPPACGAAPAVGAAPPNFAPAERAKIVDECVEAVLNALKMASER